MMHIRSCPTTFLHLTPLLIKITYDQPNISDSLFSGDTIEDDSQNPDANDGENISDKSKLTRFVMPERHESDNEYMDIRKLLW